MAKAKAELLKEGKELGLNLKSSMSMYEIQHRIKEKKEELKNAEKPKEEKPKTPAKRVRGEH